MRPSLTFTLIALLQAVSAAVLCPASIANQAQQLVNGSVTFLDLRTTNVTADCELTIPTPNGCGDMAPAFNFTSVPPELLFEADRDPAASSAAVRTHSVLTLDTNVPLTASAGATTIPSLEVTALHLSAVSPVPFEAPLTPTAAATLSPTYDILRTRFVSRSTVLAVGDESAVTLVLRFSQLSAGSPALVRIIAQCAAVAPCNTSAIVEVRHAPGSRGLLPLMMMSDSDGAGTDVIPVNQRCRWRFYPGAAQHITNAEQYGALFVRGWDENGGKSNGVQQWIRHVSQDQFNIAAARVDASFPMRTSAMEEYASRNINVRRFLLRPFEEPDLRSRYPALPIMSREGLVSMNAIEFTFSASDALGAGGVTLVLMNPQVPGNQSRCSGTSSKMVSVGQPADVAIAATPASAVTTSAVVGGEVTPLCRLTLTVKCGVKSAFNGGRELNGQRPSPMGVALSLGLRSPVDWRTITLITPPTEYVSGWSTRMSNPLHAVQHFPDLRFDNAASIERYINPNDLVDPQRHASQYEVTITVLADDALPIQVGIRAECRALAYTCPTTEQPVLVPLPEYDMLLFNKSRLPAAPKRPPLLTLYSDSDGVGPDAYSYVASNATCAYSLVCSSGMINVTRVAYNLSSRVDQYNNGINQDRQQTYRYYYNYDTLKILTLAGWDAPPITLPAIAQTPAPIPGPVPPYPYFESLSYGHKANEMASAVGVVNVTDAIPTSQPTDYSSDTAAVGLSHSPLLITFTRVTSLNGGFTVDAHCVPSVCQPQGCSPGVSPPNRTWSTAADYTALPEYAENCTTVVDMGPACLDGEEIQAHVWADAAAMDVNALFVGSYGFPNPLSPSSFLLPRGGVVVSARARPGQRIRYSVALACRAAAMRGAGPVPPECAAANPLPALVASDALEGVVVLGSNGVGSAAAKLAETCVYALRCTRTGERPNAFTNANVTISGAVSMYDITVRTGSDNNKQPVYETYYYYDRVTVTALGAPTSAKVFPASVLYGTRFDDPRDFTESAIIRTPAQITWSSVSAKPGGCSVDFRCLPQLCTWFSNRTGLPEQWHSAPLAAAGTMLSPTASTATGGSIDHIAGPDAEGCSVSLVLSSSPDSPSALGHLVVLTLRNTAASVSSSLSLQLTSRSSRFLGLSSSAASEISAALPSANTGVVWKTSSTTSTMTAYVDNGGAASVTAWLGVDVEPVRPMNAFFLILPATFYNASMQPPETVEPSAIGTPSPCFASNAAATAAPLVFANAQSSGPPPALIVVHRGVPAPAPAGNCFRALQCPQPETQNMHIMLQGYMATTGLGRVALSSQADPTGAQVTGRQTASAMFVADATLRVLVSVTGTVDGDGFNIAARCCDVARFDYDCEACRPGYQGFPYCTAAACDIAVNCGGAARASSVSADAHGTACLCTCRAPFAGPDCSACYSDRLDPATNCTTCGARFNAHPHGYPHDCRTQAEHSAAAADERLDELLRTEGLCLAGYGVVQRTATPRLTATQTPLRTRTLLPPRPATVPLTPAPTPHTTRAPTTTTPADTPHGNVTVAPLTSTAVPPHAPPTYSPTLTQHLAASDAAIDRLKGPDPMERVLGESAAVTVIDVTNVGVLGTAFFSKSLALQGSRASYVASVAMCAFVPEEESEESLTVFPLQPEVPFTKDGSVNALYGAVLVTGALLILPPIALAIFVSAYDGEHTRAVDIASTLWAVTVCYFSGNVIRVAVTLALHTPAGDPSAAGWLVLGCCGLIAPITTAVGVPAWFLSGRRFKARMEWRPRERPELAQLAPIADPDDPRERPDARSYKCSYEDDASGGTSLPITEVAAKGAGTARVPYVAALGPFFDGHKDAVRRPVSRFAYVIEMCATLWLGAVAGYRPDTGASCRYLAIAMLLPSAGFLIYLVVVQPFISRLESVLAYICNTLQVVASIIAVAVTMLMTPSFDTLLEWLGWVNTAQSFLSMAALFMISGQRAWLAYKRHGRPALRVTSTPPPEQPLLQLPTAPELSLSPLARSPPVVAYKDQPRHNNPLEQRQR
jgi:hypothetical protein